MSVNLCKQIESSALFGGCWNSGLVSGSWKVLFLYKDDLRDSLLNTHYISVRRSSKHLTKKFSHINGV